jgi:hypothetical protein
VLPTLAFAASTARSGLRRPAPWVAAGLGSLALWGGSTLEILALGEGSRAQELAVGTAEGVALLLAALLLPAWIGEDAASGWGASLSASRVGLRGRLTGRYLGAWALALAAGVPSLLLAVAAFEPPAAPLHPSWPPALVVAAAVACAWAVALARVLPPAAAALGTVVVVALSRVGEGAPVRALLPAPVDPLRGTSGSALLAQALAAAALVFGSFALGRRDASENAA